MIPITNYPEATKALQIQRAAAQVAVATAAKNAAQTAFTAEPTPSNRWKLDAAIEGLRQANVVLTEANQNLLGLP